MEEVKNEEDLLNADRHAFLKQHKKLRQEHELLSREMDGHRKNEETLNRLHAQGLIDERGNPVNPKKREISKD
jgi:cell division septum initiation protein DivIVA